MVIVYGSIQAEYKTSDKRDYRYLQITMLQHTTVATVALSANSPKYHMILGQCLEISLYTMLLFLCLHLSGKVDAFRQSVCVSERI